MSGLWLKIFLESNDAAEYVAVAQEGPWEFRVRGYRTNGLEITVPFPNFSGMWKSMLVDRMAWPSKFHLPSRHVSHGQKKAGCQKFASLQKQ